MAALSSSSESNITNPIPEIVNIKKILGLESNKKYKNIKSLRYGKIMIMTDQDHDGFHIKGLLINMFHYLWPELLNFDFISYMITPIVKVSLNKKVKPFYTLTDYEKWNYYNSHMGNSTDCNLNNKMLHA